MNIFRRVWEWWKPVGQVIGDFIGRVVLTLFYATIFMPFGLGVRWLGDPLDTKVNSGSGWLPRKNPEASIKEARRLS